MVQISNLKKSYLNPSDNQNLTILDIPSFQLEAGQHVGLRGASGSGKTTLLHTIAGMVKPDSGSITILNKDITTLGESQRDRFRANHIGYIFQSFNLLDGFTALENVMLGMIFADKGAKKDLASQLLEKTGLGNRLHYKPSQLSVGQQQRVCVARAIANNPELILADEPTGSLDTKTSREILDLIFSVAEGRMLLLVSHEPEVLDAFSNTMDLHEINKAATS
jgi:ABC-type lipoprotein export system ATPase subunit